MILLIDNYDSFAHNLARYFTRLGQEVHVERNDAINASDAASMQPQAIVISPGPCTPAEAGCSLEVVRRCDESIPILGVCLGHQTIAAALGGEIISAREPMHGRTSRVTHDGTGVFAGLPSPLEVCRYHSLAVREDSLPDQLIVNARSGDGEVMAIRHRMLPLVGLQFHPEAILSDAGYQLLAAFLRQAGIEHLDPAALQANEFQSTAVAEQRALPERPVTF